MRIVIKNITENIQKIKNWLVILAVALLSNCTDSVQPVKTFSIYLPAKSGPVAQRASELLSREITERSGAKVSKEGSADFTVELAVQPGIGTEGFTIADDGKGKIKITGNDENGLLYGIGKFLHTSAYNNSGFTPGAWRGTLAPKCPIRGIHLPMHAGNYFEEAPEAELLRYIEDLSLWGTNILFLDIDWEDGVQNLDDPKAQSRLSIMQHLMRDAGALGIKIGIVLAANEGFGSTPAELRYVPGTRFFGCSDQYVCPSKPGATELLLKNWGEMLDRFSDSRIDYVVCFPYDSGGCGCKDCSPWGGNGYPKLCQALTSVLKDKSPGTKVVVSTWMFDVQQQSGPPWNVTFREDGEYGGLAGYLEKHPGWADYLMVDAHEDFPRYPLDVGTPGGLPMVGFPEITMWGNYPWGPWGEFGAIPLPGRFQRLWDQCRDKMLGGAPYSEGIFADINEVLYMQFYWQPDRAAKDIVKEYIAYEYSPKVTEAVSRAVEILEQNHMRRLIVDKKKTLSPGIETVYQGSRFEFVNTDRTPVSQAGMEQVRQSTEEAFRLMKQADAQLTKQAKESWRWRILYLRALLDRQLVLNDGWIEGPEMKAAFEELTRIFHSENTSYSTHVPLIDDAGVKYPVQGDKP